MSHAFSVPDGLTLSARKQVLDTAPDALGCLRETDASVAAADASGETLRQRLAEDGYVFVRGWLDRDQVTQARRVLVEKLAQSGDLDPLSDPMEAVVHLDKTGGYFRPDLADDNPPLMEVLYGSQMRELFGRLLETGAEGVRPFDFTWLRAVGPGGSTAPHCDTVYMGRGTPNVLTCWTPLGDISLRTGGLMVLEQSHQKRNALGDYTRRDVDSFCANGPNADAIQTGKMNWEQWGGNEAGKAWDGAISHEPAALRETLGGRWLTCPEFRMGDVLVFSLYTVHASLNNQSNRVRLSSDTRYQRASEPIDERWVCGPNGERPLGHGLAAKKGRIC